MQFKASGRVWRPRLGFFLSAAREESGDLETDSTLALGGENLSIEASRNFEKFQKEGSVSGLNCVNHRVEHSGS
jgi:hypothetical protein